MVNYKSNRMQGINIQHTMKTLCRTLFQHYMAFRLWWYCRTNQRIARRVACLSLLVQEEADVLLGRLR